MARYKITGNGYKDTELGVFIPKAEGNRHYQQVLDWLAAGNIPDPEFTEAELLEQDRLERLSAQLSSLKSHDTGLFKMLWEMFEVGRAKGLWATADFPVDLVAMAQDWKTKLDEIEAIEAETIIT